MILLVYKVWNRDHKRYVGNELRPYGKEKIYWDRELLNNAIRRYDGVYGDTFGEIEIHVFDCKLIGKEFIT